MKLSNRPLREQWKQLALLGVLGVVLVVAWRQYVSPTVDDATASNPAAAGSATVADGPLALPSALRLASLEPVGDQPSAGRNPFRFGVPPPPPAPPPRPPPPPQQQQPVGPAPPPPGPPPPPIIALKFIGLIQLPAGTKVASLSDGRGVMLGKEGDIIDGRFRIVKIGVESIVMEYLDGRGRQTIPLRGTEP